METIAIIEDNLLTGDMLSEILLEEGFQVLRAYSGTEALYLLKNNTPDLILLDLILPGLDGEKVLEHIQDIPVIVLSARAEIEDKIALLNEGACDYITKPFYKEELVARIMVQLRKRKSLAYSRESTSFRIDDLTLDTLSLQLTNRSQSVKLTPTEYEILKLLMNNARYTLSRDSLLENISYESPDCTEKSLKQHIYNLRKKLSEIGSPIQIDPVRSVGFKLIKTEVA